MGPEHAAERIFPLAGIDPRPSGRAFAATGKPCALRLRDGVARAVRTPLGAASVVLRWNGAEVRAQAWGARDAVEWALDEAPRWLGADDALDGWDPCAHPLVKELDRRSPGLRLGATGLIWDELAPTILAQKVTAGEARHSWSRLVWRYGEAAPGPPELGLRLAPEPAALAGLSYADLHRFDVERRRAETLLLAARRAGALGRAVDLPAPSAVALLQNLRGLGVWTATSVIAASHGDPDVVVLRDFWLPTIVRYALTGDRRWTDDDGQMLELLAPFAGQRARVCALITAAGIMPPRRAPRQRRRSFATY